MKKYFVMAIAAILPLAFISCGSDDNGGGGGSSTTLPKLSTADAHYWASITNTGGTSSKPTPETIDMSGGDMNNIVLHYPGDQVPNPGKSSDLSDFTGAKARKAIATKSFNPWDYEWVFGTYTTTEPGTYDLGFCTLKVSGNGTNLTFTYPGGETTTATATPSTYDVFNTFDLGIWACRNWEVTYTEIEMTQGSSYGKGWNGCDFVQIANDIKQHVDFNDAILRELGGIKKISLRPNGQIYIYYKSGESQLDAGSFTLKQDNTFSWTLAGLNAGNDIINASGTGRLDFNGNTATLTMSVKAGENGKYQGYVYFKLKAIS